jgi:ADP-ribosyl-[dinitrogen reductase] hydrolase
LLAGEYPGGSTREKTKDRLKKLLAAGIECFVDLTRPTELLRYDTHLPFYVEYARKAIKDHGVPGSRAQMIEILDYVGNSMRAGRPVYVHCRAGIGRTGTVIGCLLVERGLSGDGALDELNRLWQQCKRSRSWAFIPETESQAAYVREWKPSLQSGGFELSHAAAAVSAVGPMSAAGDIRPGVLTVADVQARAASQATGAGQARAAMQNLAAGQGRGGSNSSRNAVSSPGGGTAVRADGAPVTRVAAQPSVNSLASAVVEAPAEPAESDPLLDPATLEAARGLRERFVGTLFGLAIGDAVAAATQFRRPGSFSPVGDMIGGGPFDLPRGAWSDDTAMALCLAESLLERNEFDARDQVERYNRWQQEGYLSSTGQCVGITASTARSLAIAKWRRVVFPGSHDPEQLDPEPLSRVASIALFYFASLETTLHQAAESSRTTCQAPAVLDACRRLGRALNAALSGHAKAHILAEMSPITEAAAQANNTAETALAAAFWAFSSTDNFRDAVLRAANVGGNSDVVASVCGQLAGAHYGFSAIPSSWRNCLIQKDLIEGYADRLLAHGLVSLSA